MGQFFAVLCVGTFVLFCSVLVFLMAARLIEDFRLQRLIQRRIVLVSCPSCGSKSWRVVANPFAWELRGGARMVLYVGKYVQCQNCRSYFFAADRKSGDQSAQTDSAAELDLTQLDTTAVENSLGRGRVARRRFATVMCVVVAIPAVVCATTSWYDVAVVELTLLTFVVVTLLTGWTRSWVFGASDDSTTFS